MIKYLDGDLLKEIGNKKVLVDFYADWCGPCKMQGEVLKEFNDIEILKVDIEKYQQLAKEYGIMSIPTLILFDKGELKKMKVGFMNISELREFIR